jgi:N-methylhydantoinase B
MTEPNAPKKFVNLDDLLQANKEQFDRIFGTQKEKLGLMGLSHTPLTRDDLSSASRERSSVSTPPQEHAAENSTENATERAALSAGRLAGTSIASQEIDDYLEANFLPTPQPDQPERPEAQPAQSEAPFAEPPGNGEAAQPAARMEHAADAPSPPVVSRPAVPAISATLDPITLDLIENALRNARHEMDAVLFRSAMSPVIREQHDEFPMITDPKGRMIVGQFGSYVSEMLAERPFDFHPGDVILQSDPFKCGGAISHINDWMVLVPIVFDGELMGFSSMFGHMMDVGGPVPGSMPTAATSIFGEGMKIPPLKVFDKGQPNKAVIDLLMNNTRTPEMNYSDLMAIIAGSRAGERRVIEICERFGANVYRQACEALLERTNRAMRQLIVQNLPEEPQSFEDYVDDDGLGNGPFKMKLTVWREGEHAYFDWTGTSPQAPGPINFYLHEGMFKMFIGVYMIMVFDPQILFNDGFYDLIHVTLPKGSLVHPNFPASLGCRTHALARQFDVLGGALSKNAPEMATAAGYGSSPHFLYNGVDSEGRYFQLMEILYGGIPGRPIGDGMDGHSWWPLFENIPTEYLESYYPLIIENYTTITDTGGAGNHRGGNGVEKIYRLLEAGEISIHDDRHLTQPWGILGGKPGGCSEKWLEKADGTRHPLPSKVDNVKVQPGDRIIFRTAGGGGWGDPLERDPAKVRNDVARKLVSSEAAREAYGVVLYGDRCEVDARASEDLRDQMRRSRPAAALFDFGERPA